MRKGLRWFSLIAAVLLLVAGCGGSGSSPALGENPKISGKIQNWSGSSGQIVAANIGGTILGRGTVSASGKFSLTMYSIPSESLLPLSPENTATCTTEVSNPNVRWISADFLEGPGGELVLLVDNTVNPKKVGRLVYVNGDVTVKSYGDCQYATDLNLKAGWNWTVQINYEDSKELVSKYPSGLKWVSLE